MAVWPSLSHWNTWSEYGTLKDWEQEGVCAILSQWTQTECVKNKHTERLEHNLLYRIRSHFLYKLE